MTAVRAYIGLHYPDWIVAFACGITTAIFLVLLGQTGSLDTTHTVSSRLFGLLVFAASLVLIWQAVIRNANTRDEQALSSMLYVAGVLLTLYCHP